MKVFGPHPREIKYLTSFLFRYSGLFQCLNNFFCVSLILWTQEYFTNDSFFIYHKSSAVNTHVPVTKHLFFAPHSIFLKDLMRGVCHQSKRQMKFALKLFVAGFIIWTNTQHFKAKFF